MSRKKSYLTVTDKFCGAGGNSQAVRNVSVKMGGGLEVKLALNHWKLAIETHTANFPNTDHDCTDISACDPRRYASTDIDISSPECTTHTPAGGNHHKALKKQTDMFDKGIIDPATERSRQTMFDVVRFAEYHRYRVVIVENVVEAKTRWPLFENWLGMMHTIGYNHRVLYLNSMHFHPTPQSRDRMYVVFWQKGNKAPMLDYMPRAWCDRCGQDVDSVQTWKNPLKHYGKYRQQYVYCCPSCTSVVEPYYYAAMNIIDWSNLGTRIGDRKKDLSPKTTKRINFGLEKYGRDPIIISDHYGEQARGIVRPMSDRMNTIMTTSSLKMVVPFIVKLEHGDGVRSIRDTLRTQTTRHSDMLVSLSGKVRSTLDAMSTQTTTQGQGFVTPPFITESYGNGGTREITEPVNTITAGGIKSGIVTNESWNAFISAYNNGSHTVKHFTEPLPTVTVKDRNALTTYEQPKIEDCYYRMLVPHEVKLGMAFDKDYIIKGSAKDQVKQCGNAVTPPPMEWIVERCVESLN